MIAVIDIDPGVDKWVEAIECPRGVHRALGTLRWRGVPLGQMPLLLNDRQAWARLGPGVFRQHANTILQHILRNALVTTGLERPHSLGATSAPPFVSPLPSLTIAVCTRDRPDDLARCLASLMRVDYPDLDVLVVDNSAGETARPIAASCSPRIRYQVEPCPGLNWARRRAVDEGRGDVLAFIDDDVIVETGWARAIVAPLAANPDVGAVTGLVMPLELTHQSQQRFEQAGGLGRGFRRRWFRRRHDELTAPRFANTGICGVGAAMAFRRAFLIETGSFDPALGAGTCTGGGDDLDLFFRVLKAGDTLVYEPAAASRHRHRASMAAVRAQLENWCQGMLAYLERTRCAYPDEARAVSRLAAALVALYYPRRILHALVDPRLSVSLALAEWRGARSGRHRYHLAVARARELAREFGLSQEALVPRATARARRVQPGVWPLQVALDDPLPPVLENPDARDEVAVTVTWRGRVVRTLQFVTGGHALGQGRLADAIAAGLLTELIDADHPWRGELRARLGA